MERKQFMPPIEKINSVNTKDSSGLNALQEKVLKAAKKETSGERIATSEEKERASLNEIRQNFKELIEAEEKDKEEKQLREQLKMEEDAYYRSYQDNDDTESTVITMSYNADFIHYIRFVSSLRDNGYGGTIMIGMEKYQDEEIIQYLKSQNVIIKTLVPTECTFESANPLQKCYHPYPNIRREWSHFPLIRDWLSACPECTGPVLFVSSMKRAYFQSNPIVGAEAAVLKERLHIFQHHPSFDAAFTPDAQLLKTCHNIDFPATLLINPKYPKFGSKGGGY